MWLLKCVKGPPSEHLSEINVLTSETLLKSATQLFYPILPSFSDKLNWETSLLVGFEILGLFVNILITDGKFSRNITGNYLQPLQPQKFFCEDFITILKSR